MKKESILAKREEEFKQHIINGKTNKELTEIYSCNIQTVYKYKRLYGFIGMSPNSNMYNIYDGKKMCRACGKTMPLSSFHTLGKYKERQKYRSLCKSCEITTNYVKKTNRIKKVLSLLGREYKCETCGYDKNYAVLCFHHKNPKEKKFSISSTWIHNINKLTKEIAKCSVLCANCHTELHNPNSSRDSIAKKNKLLGMS